MEREEVYAQRADRRFMFAHSFAGPFGAFPKDVAAISACLFQTVVGIEIAERYTEAGVTYDVRAWKTVTRRGEWVKVPLVVEEVATARSASTRRRTTSKCWPPTGTSTRARSGRDAVSVPAVAGVRAKPVPPDQGPERQRPHRRSTTACPDFSVSCSAPAIRKTGASGRVETVARGAGTSDRRTRVQHCLTSRPRRPDPERVPGHFPG